MSAPAEKEPCSEVLSRMYFFIDRELADADSAQIQQHLDDCGPCLSEVALERVVKALIARSCVERAPVELRQRVMFSIHRVQLEFGQVDGGPLEPGQPGPWNRPAGQD